MSNVDVNLLVFHYKTPEQLSQWTSSLLFRDLMQFVTSVCYSLHDTDMHWETYLLKKEILDIFSSDCYFHLCFLSRAYQNIHTLLDSFDMYEKSTDKSYKQFICRILDYYNLPVEFMTMTQHHGFTVTTFNTELIKSKEELILILYVVKSLGNIQRQDYGTGHELHFLFAIFLANAFDQSVVTSKYSQFVVFFVLHYYYNLIRRVINKFRLMPAGSRGQWGLDDYFFIPFLFGASQCHSLGDRIPKLTTILDCAKEAKKYYFYELIMHLHKSKSHEFTENSSLICMFEEMSSWDVIEKGLLKMYQKEVLSAYPVVQHLTLIDDERFNCRLK